MQSVTEVKVEPFDDKKKYSRFSRALPEGGLGIPDEENTFSIMLDLMKKYGPQIKDGTMDVTSLPRPAKLCSHMSVLENIANDMILCTPYLNKAAETTDPLKRMKLVAAYLIGSWHRNTSQAQKGGFEPVLGETVTLHKEDGTTYYGEQISTKPKLLMYSMYGPDKKWWAHGWGDTKVSFGANSLDGQRGGKTTIYFRDGSEIQITNPGIRLDGLLMGKKVLNMIKKPFIVDKKNSLMGEIYFNFDNGVDAIKELAKKNKKYWFENPSKVPTDYHALFISKYTKDPKTNEIKKDYQSFGTGSWLEYVQIDNEVYWRLDDPIDDWLCTDEDKILPSHSRHRPDYPLAVAKEYEKADVEKDKLEIQQGLDQKLRESKGKK